MRQTLELINGEWKWCDNPMLEEAMKHPRILKEGEEIQYSVVTDEQKQRAIPVHEIIEKFNKEYGLRFDWQDTNYFK